MKATIELTKKEIKRGAYNATAHDNEKAQADFLLQAIDGKYYTIFLNREIELPKGAQRYNAKQACITGKREFEKFAKNYNWECDF